MYEKIDQKVRNLFFSKLGCNHVTVKTLSESYDSNKFATQKSKCIVCKDIIAFQVERPTIREQRSRPKVFQKSKEIEARFLQGGNK